MKPRIKRIEELVLDLYTLVQRHPEYCPEKHFTIGQHTFYSNPRDGTYFVICTKDDLEIRLIMTATKISFHLDSDYYPTKTFLINILEDITKDVELDFITRKR